MQGILGPLVRSSPAPSSNRIPGLRKRSAKPATQTHYPPPGASTIKIFTIPPSFASTFHTKMAKLSCLVTDLATYDSLTISWTRQNGKDLKTHTNISEILPNATFSVVGEATVCVEEWESGEEFTCTVTHTDLPFPLKHTIFRPKGRPCPALCVAQDPHSFGRGWEHDSVPPVVRGKSYSTLSSPLPLLPQKLPSTCPLCTCYHPPGNS